MFRIIRTEKGFAVFAKFGKRLKQFGSIYANKSDAIKQLCRLLYNDAKA